MASLVVTDFCSCAPLVLADGTTGVGFACAVLPAVLGQTRPHFFEFLRSFPGASAGAGGALHVSAQLITRLAIGSCRLGPADADGAWPVFASTPTADFTIKFLKAAGESSAFDAAQLFGIDASGQARILNLVYDASDSRFVITSADVTSVGAAVLAAVDSVAAPMALARADEFCGTDRRMQACAVSLLLAPASCDLTALAADDAGAARLVEAAAAPAHMVSGLDRAGAAVGGSDRTAVYRFIAAAAGAKYCLAWARSNAGVVANVRAANMFERDRSAALEEHIESAIQWFPRLHAALGVSTPEAPAVARLYTLVAGMPASPKSPLTIEGLYALEFQVSRVPGQADFKTVCAAFHESAESVAALKSGVTVLRPLLEDSAYKALVDAGKGVDAKELVAMAIGSGLAVTRGIVLDGLPPGLAKQGSQVPVLAELAAKRHSIREASRGLMAADDRVERTATPPDVPPHYLVAALRGTVSPNLSYYAALASTFSPKRFAENPHCFLGANVEIFSNPAGVAAALAMFAATFGPVADGFGYDGFDTFIAAVGRATADLAGRRNMTNLVVDLFESGMRDAMDFGLASMQDVRLNAKFESRFDGPAFAEAAARLAAAHSNHDVMERFFQTANYGAVPIMAPPQFPAPPSYVPPYAPTGSLASPGGAQLAPAAPFGTAAWGAGAPASGPTSALVPAALPMSSPPTPLHSSRAPEPSSGSRVVRPSSRVAAQAAAAPKRLSVAIKLPDGSPFIERMVIKSKHVVRVGIFGYPAAVYETHSMGCPTPFVIRLATGVKVLPDQLATFRQGLCTIAGEAHAHGASSAHRNPPEKLVALASVRFEVPDGGWPELPNVPKKQYFGGPRRGP